MRTLLFTIYLATLLLVGYYSILTVHNTVEQFKYEHQLDVLEGEQR